MMKPRVSVIVPLYNSAGCLSRCIDSILNQTYRNIEIIVINDGSTDTSGAICQQYARQDTRIIFINKQNHGVSEARNDGINTSTGKYLQFVDSDDYLDSNMIEIMVAALEANSASLAVCGYKTIDSATGKCVQKNYCEKDGFYLFDEMLNIFDDLYQRYLINASWNKMYLANIIRDNSIFYEKNLELGEDLIFNLEVIKKSFGFAIISACPYNYIKYNNGGTLTGKNRENIYEIQKLLFQQAMSLYEDPSSYSEQIYNLEMAFSRMLITGAVLQLANGYGLENYKVYLKAAKHIRADVILKKFIKCLEPKSRQEVLMKFLMRNELFFSIFLYAKMKQYLRRRMPAVFGVLEGWGNRKLERDHV